jgi:AhpD family alkylhydroperoxidase
MEPRFNVQQANPDAVRPLLAMSQSVRQSGLDTSLIHLIEIRASQINGCGFCLDMHTKDARAAGESEERIYLLSAWREAPFYTDVERVVLELTEAVTLIANGGVSDDLYARVREHFDEAQFVSLIMSINAINSWNRLNIAVENLAGRYQPAAAVTH